MRNLLFLTKAKILEDSVQMPVLQECFYLMNAYNPEWKSWIEEHPWCATIIESEVEYYIDEEAHIVGTGSINFYTAQTGV